MKPCACACWPKASATTASGSGTATNGSRTSRKSAPSDKPEILDDPRLEPATQWLRQLDWFTPEPGLWVGDANENFLSTLAARLGRTARRRPNASATRRFTGSSCTPRQLRPRLVVKGSGIDWLAVSAEWEQEGLKLTRGRFATARRPPPAASSNCRTPAGSNWTPTPFNPRTKPWPTSAWMAWCPSRNASAWNKPRIWTKRA